MKDTSLGRVGSHVTRIGTVNIDTIHVEIQIVRVVDGPPPR